MASNTVKQTITPHEEVVAAQVVDSALRVHRALGRGLLEAAYQACLAHELRKRGLHVACEVPQPLYYDGVKVDVAYRLDMLIDGCVVIENKAVDLLTEVHVAQLLNYLHLRGGGIGFLINWNVKLIRDGLHRYKV